MRAGDRVVENQALLRDHWEGEGELRFASLSIFLFLYLNVIAGFVFGAQLISTLRQKQDLNKNRLLAAARCIRRQEQGGGQQKKEQGGGQQKKAGRWSIGKRNGERRSW